MSAHDALGQQFEQLDMFKEHLRDQMKGQSGPTTYVRGLPNPYFAGPEQYAAPEELETVWDKKGRMTHITRHHNNNPSRVHPADADVTVAWTQDDDGGYQPSGFLYASARPRINEPGIEERGPQEVSMINVPDRMQHRGIATALWKVASRDRDLRHSDIRTSEGFAWSKKVGGKDIHGKDVSKQRMSDRGMVNP